jgi:catechol 2,3-dioxygenase-like lactoylglutathione lyase family enzyme
MGIRRIVPNIKSSQLSLSRDFYVDFLGLGVGMDMGWIVNLGSSTNSTAQLNVLQDNDSPAVHPDVTVEVDDVDEVDESHARAVARGYQIIYPLTDEPWGVRRFFVVDPNGVVLNIMSHVERRKAS